MSKYKSFFGLLVILIVVGILSSVARQRGIAVRQPEWIKELTRQTGTSRQWREVTYTEVWSLGEGGPVKLFGPLRVKADARDHLYVADYGEFKIKELSPDGELIRVYGNGQGQGPGELTSLTDFEITSTGEVWLADRTNGRITVFSAQGELLRTIKTEKPPYRMVVDERSGGAVIMLPFGSPRLFGLLDSEGKLQHDFGELLENQALNSLVLDGFAEADHHDGFVYAGSLTSVVAGFGFDGKPRFQVEMIDPEPLPTIRHDSEKMWIDRDIKHTTVSLSVTRDEIHVFTYFISGIQHHGALDTHRLADGAYLYSRKIPANCNWLAVGEKHFYTVLDTTITKWAVADPASPAAAGS